MKYDRQGLKLDVEDYSTFYSETDLLEASLLQHRLSYVSILDVLEKPI